ncbi:MAG: hypothetical protein LBL93_02050 [Ruminococcus sp.]|jgi:hypothetical protein|nr:hypothetical protein [Ruminococcus sp.]
MKKKIQTYSDNKKERPIITLKFSVIIWIFVLIFAACFGAYMINVNSHPEKYFAEWAGSDKADSKDKNGGDTGVINPVPLSKAVNEKYFDDCVFVGVMQFADFKNIINPSEITQIDKSEIVYAREISEDKIKEIKKAKPKNIYIINDIPVKGDNTETDRKNRELLDLANSLDVHYLDINTAFKDNNGSVNIDYINIDGSLNELGILKYKEYILTHIIN